ncbi:MAG: hypothetical protein HY731_04680, partial [Candidatus Tectomicrobia bacterium]|nr:hypothetical protein [Candidatus Tectomicrobia bacterium]
MRWFLNLPTRAKIFLGFGLIIIFMMVVIGGTTYKSIESVKDFQIFVVGGLISLLIGMVMAFFLNRIIATPLKKISEIAEKVASG